MGNTKESADNALLASSCGAGHSACCKSGFIFLPKQEFEAILQYLETQPENLKEFTSRVTDFGNFLLYNQKTRCQFLLADEQCELHPLGIKPTECFWWPAHVYLADDGTLEIRVANCCTGCNLIQPNSPHVEKVAEQARTIGLPIITEFRKAHSYGKDYRVVMKF